MKSLLLNTYDVHGGAALATYRLHKGLISIGLDSIMHVQTKYGNDVSVEKSNGRLDNLMDQIHLRNYLDILPVKFYPKRVSTFSPALVPDSVRKKIQSFNPDIVHLFWISAGFIRIESLKDFKKPLVWTLHDMWPFTGGCHYDDECSKYTKACGSCPILKSNKDSDLSRNVWQRKMKSWANLNLTIVATSEWIAKCAKESSLFKDRRIEVIPNGFDITNFKPVNKSVARQAFNLPLDKKLIFISAFGATTDLRKGFHFLKLALEKIAQKKDNEIELVILGSSTNNAEKLSIKTHHIGFLQDEISQVLLYSAADVLVLPSRQENLSNTVIEAMLCGTPVVAFEIGGMPDMIMHKINGYLAKPFEVNDLADGILWVLSDLTKDNGLSLSARRIAIEKYNIELISKEYSSLYSDIAKCE